MTEVLLHSMADINGVTLLPVLVGVIFVFRAEYKKANNDLSDS